MYFSERLLKSRYALTKQELEMFSKRSQFSYPYFAMRFEILKYEAFMVTKVGNLHCGYFYNSRPILSSRNNFTAFTRILIIGPEYAQSNPFYPNK